MLLLSCQSTLLDDAHEAPVAGHLGFALTIADGIDIDALMYTITRGDGFETSGTIPLVANDDTFKTLLLLPSASAYRLELEAHTVEGAVCRGHARFDIWPERKTLVNVVMRCPGAPRFGTANVDGLFNICPAISSVLALPQEAAVGQTVGLYASGTDQDGDSSALRYLWTTTSGSLSDDMAATASLRCTQAGVAVVRLSLSDGDVGCDTTSPVINVTCLEASSPNPNPPIDAGASGLDANSGDADAGL